MSQALAVLSAKDLCVGYGKKTVLENVRLEFLKGEFISLLGPNGAGKTTLLRTLSRHLAPLGGEVALGGVELGKIVQQDLARTMSVVLTEKVAPPLLRVFDFVAMGRYPHTGWQGRLTDKDNREIMAAIAMVQAEALVYRDLDTLSDGERQKIYVARALAQQPKIILLDEPTMHLDLKHRIELMSILRRLCRDRGICVVASLHDVEIAAKLSDKVALVKAGEIRAFGPPEEVLQEDTVTDLYDFSNARFNRLLGTIEMTNPVDRGRVFVVGGMGSSSVLYRLLSKKGYGIVTGVLHRNDIDLHVAQSLGADCLVQDLFEAISRESMETARKEMETCDCVIDTGFGVEAINSANLDLLKTAVSMGKPVLSMRNGSGRALFTPKEYGAIQFSTSETHLVERVKCLSRPI
jgi:iron complex transport system ATP-binding protein